MLGKSHRSGRVGLDRLRVGVGVRDLDAARLHRLGHHPRRFDVQEAVLQAGTLYLDMLGQLEAALEGAAGNAAIQELGLLASASAFSPLTVSVFSRDSIESSPSPKPATAIVMR